MTNGQTCSVKRFGVALQKIQSRHLYRGATNQRDSMSKGVDSSRPVAAIAAATVGVYVLIMAGATTSITEATAACASWPTCDGQWVLSLDDPQRVIAVAHRVAALVVGALVVGAAVVSWPGASRRVKTALIVAVGLYPIQVTLGGLVAVQGPFPVLSGLHLLVGIGIFTGFVLALALTLHERDIGTSSDRSVGETAHRRTLSEPSPPTTSPVRSTVVAYARLMKPRLMWLLCLVAAAGMGLAAGSSLTVETVVATLGGGVLAIGASGTFNHVLERDLDRRMNRTADRPVVTDQVGVRPAVVFGIALTVASIGVFLSVNVLAAALGLTAILYYSVVYTLVLKPRTVQNTVIGGLAGSFPALIGAAAASETVGLPAIGLAVVIFLWTPAHFYNLALAYKDDYARGDVPMLPVVRGEATTRFHILLYLGATFVAVALLSAISDLGFLYALTAVGFGAVFLWMVIRLHHEPSRPAALRSFHASNAYLGALLIAIVVDTVLI